MKFVSKQFVSKFISYCWSALLKSAPSSGLLIILFLSGAGFSAHAQTNAQDQDNVPKLQVGLSLTNSEPYLIQPATDDDEVHGIAVDVWDEIVKDQNFEYEWVFFPDYEQGVDAVAQGEIDVFVGAVTINIERLKKVDFTQPFDDAPVTLMVRDQSPSVWSRVRPFLRIAALSSIMVLGGLIFVVGNVMWFVERQENSEHFPRAYLPGIENGMWFALVTMTTVGYGDRAPITRAGRWVAGLWMVTSLFTVSSVTAGLASAFTVSLSGNFKPQFQSVADLRNAKLAVLPTGASARWAEYYQADVTEVDSIEAAAQALINEEVDGFINHRPTLLHFLNQNPHPELSVSNLIITTELYGFAIPRDSEQLQRDLDFSIIKAKENGKIKQSKDWWFEVESLTKSRDGGEEDEVVEEIEEIEGVEGVENGE